MGFGRSPSPSYPSDKEIAGSSFCLQSERPRKEEKGGKVRNVFTRGVLHPRLLPGGKFQVKEEKEAK